MNSLTKEQYKKTLKIASRNARSREDAEDFTQSTYLNLLEYKSRDIKYINRYLYQVIADEIRDSKGITRRVYTVALESARHLASTFDMDEFLFDKNRQALVLEYMETPEFKALPVSQQLIIKGSLTGDRPPHKNLTNNRRSAFKHLTGFLAQQGAI